MKNRENIIDSDTREHKMVKHDFIFVVALNALLFALMLGVFFWNRATGGLDRIFEQIIKF